MKRRKPPIVLIGVLAIFLFVVAFFSMNYSKWTGGQDKMTASDDQPALGESREGASKQEFDRPKEPQLAPTPGTPGGAPPPKIRPPKGGAGNASSINVGQQQRGKPVPDDSSTGTNWWHEESNKK